MNGPARVGILGGSFNPVHFGHIQLAHAAVEQLRLDELLVVPAEQNPFKPDSELAPSADRLEMLRLAEPALPGAARIETFELEHPPPSYTIDTVRHLRGREEYAEARLYLVMGLDTALKLDQWKEVEELAEECDLAVFRRKGIEARVEELRATVEPLGFNLHYYNADILEVSGSGLRELHNFREVAGRLLPGAVADYIEEKGLYQASEPA